MQRQMIAIALMTVIVISAIGLTYGQEAEVVEETQEPEIVFSEFQFAVIGISVFAGLVTAYNGYAKNKREQGDKFSFDWSKFLDRVFMAVLGSIPLAVMESANVIKLDLFGAWIIFAAALGTSQLIMEVRARRGK